ncbi:MAG: hypothetical protein NC902_07285 [Candidatus Omnitrophica bacterium]|nr:hypothetical protein [Candidatus Omnitrophota bacterium]
MEKEEIFQRIKLKWNEYVFDDKIWINLTKLGYQKHSEVNLPDGSWQIYQRVKTPDIETHLNKKQKILFFFAVWSPASSNKKFPITGMCENIDEVINGLKFISSLLPENRYGGFRLQKKLDVQNAQDYGYIRGLLCGFFLMLIDILPWHIGTFRPQGIMSTFLEYTRIVYYGTPGFAIIVGMAAIGVYFTVLFIVLPIITANLYMIKARRIERATISSLPDILHECEYGQDAELFLDQQLRYRVENIKKEEIFKRAASIWENIKKQDIYELYEILKSGVISTETLYDIIKRTRHACGDFDFMEFLKIMIDTVSRDTEVLLKISEEKQVLES